MHFPIDITWYSSLSDFDWNSGDFLGYSQSLRIDWTRIKTPYLSSIGDVVGFNAYPEKYRNSSLPMLTTQTAMLNFEYDRIGSGDEPVAVLHSKRCELDLCLRTLNVTTSSGITTVIPTNTQILQQSGQDIMLPGGANGSFMCWKAPSSRSSGFNDYIGSPFPQNMSLDQFNNRYLLYPDSRFCIQRGTLPDMYGWLNAFAGQLVGEGVLDASVNSTFTGYFYGAYDPSVTTSVLNSTSCDDPRISDPCHGPICDCFYGKSASYWTLNAIGAGKADVWNSTGPETIFERLSASLNLLMVDPPTNPNATSMVYGQNGVFVTYVQVCWPWMTLPYILMVGGTVFLVSTNFRGRRMKAPLWKSSANALLYHGLEDESEVTKSGGGPTTASSKHYHTPSASKFALSTIREMKTQAAANTNARPATTSKDGRMLLLSSGSGNK